MKLGIFAKGLIFLLIPLALQVIFLGGLLSLEAESERLARREAQLSLLLDLATRLSIKLLLAGGEIGSSIWEGTSERKIDPTQYKIEVQQILDQMKDMTADNPHVMQAVKVATSIFANQYEVLCQISKTPSSEVDFAGKLLRFRRLRPKLKQTFFQLENLRYIESRERVDLEASLRETLANRQTVRAEIIAGIVLDILMTIGLLSIFLLNVTNRLRLLVDNARSIPSGVVPAKRVTGNDELSFLDGVLRQVAEELRRAAEHRATVTRMLVHDLRSPLQSSMLAVDSLREPKSFSSPEAFNAEIDLLKGSMTTMVALIENLLTIEKLEAGKLELNVELFDISFLVDDCAKLVSPKAQRRNISITNRVGQFEVAADKLRISQVLLNLISNALNYSPDGGTVTVSSRLEPKKLIVSVSDHGAGIPAEKQGGLFSRYYQVDPGDTASGFGLGLVICKFIISQHLGAVGVTSEPGKGSTFWFTLPVDPE